jgi:hypothetical protein
MSNAPPVQHRKLWEEKSVIVAAILAILVPGLGHLFQGRTVKGFIYLFGILGLFLWGVKLGEGVVVYNLPDRGAPRRITLHYAAQLAAGAVSYPALWQTQRIGRQNTRLVQLDQPLTAAFSGRLTTSEEDPGGGKLDGTISLKPEPGDYGTETKGTFNGTLDGQPVELNLSGGLDLDPPIAAGYRRRLKCNMVRTRDVTAGAGKVIVGSIPRSIINWYGVPPDTELLQEVTGRLGKLHELALVFTWIAGLLNILAIWDCIQGPAYGFGDEPMPAGEANSDAKRGAPVPENKTAATA